MSDPETRREVIFETIACGDTLKISAIDVQSGIEVSIIAPKNANEDYARNIAARKLERRLQRNLKSDDRGGIIV
ncbi:MAG: serine hydroxymethyltransferase [Robiginitomaculum sp.]|nr:MAG: serine hydroxymethyltransferase [Robiginitomaculum sp.]